MSYCLGIDLGTTYLAAAIARDGRVEMVPLGNRAMSIPSVVCLREDATVLVGEAAERRAAIEPARVAREFKRRVGDTTPIIVGGAPYSAEALMAKLLRHAVDEVAELEGGPPERVAVTHPANWGPYKKDLLHQAVRIADVENVTYLSEPEAAAAYYASHERVELGAVVAVYDLGGGTFDATVLRKAADGFEILGRPEGIERLGGIDFDEAVFQHVRAVAGDAVSQLDPADPNAVSAVARLRQGCVDAKEALSGDTDAVVSVTLPGMHTEVRITRVEFEAMVAPRLVETIDAMRRALRSAAVEGSHLSSVLLVGGSSRMPLVAHLVSADLDRPVSVDAHPKHAVALGAALVAADAATPGAPVAESGPVEAVLAPAGVVAAGAAAETRVLATAGDGSAAGVLPGRPLVGASAGGPTAPDAVAASGGPSAPTALPPFRASSPQPEPPHRGAHRAVSRHRSHGSRRRWHKAFAVGAVAVVLAAAAAVATYGILATGKGDESTRAASAAVSKATSVPSGHEGHGGDLGTSCGSRKLCVQIEDVTVKSGRYEVDYETSGFTESPDVETGDHVHFYWNVNPATGEPQSEAQSGANVPKSRRGFYVAYGGGSPFAEFTVEDRPQGATEICALKAAGVHEITENSGTCFPLPSS